MTSTLGLSTDTVSESALPPDGFRRDRRLLISMLAMMGFFAVLMTGLDAWSLTVVGPLSGVYGAPPTPVKILLDFCRDSGLFFLVLSVWRMLKGRLENFEFFSAIGVASAFIFAALVCQSLPDKAKAWHPMAVPTWLAHSPQVGKLPAIPHLP